MALNSLSFGNCSYSILRELWRRKIDCSIFPIGPVDVSAFDKIDPNFKAWLENGINNRLKTWRQEDPLLKLWHFDGSSSGVCANKRYLISFYELDAPTEEELNTVNNQTGTFLTSNYARTVFLLNGADETRLHYIPLGFDEDFRTTNKTYFPDRIHFVINGKFEARKNTAKILNLWAKKYGNNPKYYLTCAVFNPFYGRNPEEAKANNDALINQALEGKRYHNINQIGYMKTNSEVNDFLNSADIDLSGLSSGEGWSLPSFNATCLGKWSVVLNAHAHKDWATAENSVLVKPAGTKRPATDGVFFRQGGPFNSGNLFNISDEAIIDGFERAEKVAKTPNPAGIELGKKLTYKNTVDKILEVINP